MQSKTQAHFGNNLTSALFALAANTVVKTVKITRNAIVNTATLDIPQPYLVAELRLKT